MNIAFEDAAALVIATAVLGLSPGPAVFAILARSISNPLRRTFLFILGIVIGDFVFAMMAMAGVALLVSQHQIIFVILKYVGGGYLLYLGMKALFTKSSVKYIQDRPPETGWKLMTSGFLLTAGNPKDLLFFVSFLPAFIDLRVVDIQQMCVMAALIVITFFCTLSFYAGLVSFAKNWLHQPKVLLWLDNAAGLILIIVGSMILFLH